MDQVTVAAVQLVSGTDVTENLSTATELIKSAIDQGSQLIVLPENFACFGGGIYRQLAEQESAQSRIISTLKAALEGSNAWLVAGSMPSLNRAGNEADPVPEPRVRSCCAVINADGQIEAHYDKIHLFDVSVNDAQGRYKESNLFEAGDRPTIVQTPVGKLGLSICYDLRFPELYRHYAAQQVPLITVPSAFTYATGEAHWELLLRARAVENQAFVIAANQGGWHDQKRQTYGHSMIVDPWGEILAEAGQGPDVVVASLDMNRLNAIRQKMPVLEHRRIKGA